MLLSQRACHQGVHLNAAQHVPAGGLPGPVGARSAPHDRLQPSAGVAERLPMRLSEHLTRSVFERYNIVSEGELWEAVAKLDAATGESRGQSRTRPNAAIPVSR